MQIVPALPDLLLTDITNRQTIAKEKAEELFAFFQSCSLFNWNDSHNGCEGRADALCVLMDAWCILNYKAWVFGGYFLRKHVGYLQNNWGYHVAPVVSVKEGDYSIDYVIDPSTGNQLKTVEEWAADITELPHSYYAVRASHWYIFPAGDIRKEQWNPRDRQNRKWMIECIAGINSLSKKGKAELIFKKKKIEETKKNFEKLKTVEASLLRQ